MTNSTNLEDELFAGKHDIPGLDELEQGDINNAIYELNNYLTKKPYNNKAWYFLGLSYLRRKEPETALTFFEKAYKIDENNLRALEKIIKITEKTLTEKNNWKIKTYTDEALNKIYDKRLLNYIFNLGYKKNHITTTKMFDCIESLTGEERDNPLYQFAHAKLIFEKIDFDKKLSNSPYIQENKYLDKFHKEAFEKEKGPLKQLLPGMQPPENTTELRTAHDKINKALAIDNKNFSYWLLKANIENWNQQTILAKNSLHQASMMAPNHPLVLEALARIAGVEKKPDEGLRIIKYIPKEKRTPQMMLTKAYLLCQKAFEENEFNLGELFTGDQEALNKKLKKREPLLQKAQGIFDKINNIVEQQNETFLPQHNMMFFDWMISYRHQSLERKEKAEEFFIQDNIFGNIVPEERNDINKMEEAMYTNALAESSFPELYFQRPNFNPLTYMLILAKGKEEDEKEEEEETSGPRVVGKIDLPPKKEKSEGPRVVGKIDLDAMNKKHKKQ